MVGLDDLPEHVLAQIFNHLPSVPELDYFTRTSPHTYRCLNGHLYRFALLTEFRVAPKFRLLPVWAIEEGRVSTFRQCVDVGLSPSCVVESGNMSLLMLAVRFAQVEMADILLAKGANVAHTDADGWTALHHLRNLREPTVEAVLAGLLVGRGADINARDRFGYRPVDYWQFWQNADGKRSVRAKKAARRIVGYGDNPVAENTFSNDNSASGAIVVSDDEDSNESSNSAISAERMDGAEKTMVNDHGNTPEIPDDPEGVLAAATQKGEAAETVAVSDNGDDWHAANRRRGPPPEEEFPGGRPMTGGPESLASYNPVI
ncbi:hypothetical protein BZA05DRAFT_464047 [Tricharina praecox]|uniref:uncharacterized protein n=1 Tax=Tricharina praecox TaxID=43433 RepID=UPI002220032B|nr:uncharacterized protein BZA05DRAFT_464047 [Tricharina praecox]KAI5842253.1 hypothetical protein BZA05DRAFT_464047 [Tricharina praecox]